MKYDVIVAGAGPAGICAAVSASRMGAKTAIIEQNGIIGGNLTSGHVGPIMGAVAPGTLRDEVVSMLGTGGKSIHHDVETAKILLTKWIHKEKVDVYLNSTVIGANVDGKRLTGLTVFTRSGAINLNSTIVIDATGDGMVSDLAGTQWEIGRDDGLMQPATIMFTLSGIAPDTKIVCRHEEDDTIVNGESYLELCKQSEKNGELPQNVSIVRLYPTLRSDERMVNASQLNKANGLDPLETAKAQLALREQLPIIHKFLQNHIHGFEHSYIKDSSDGVGFRETRRIMGEYILTGKDIVSGRKFDDVIVHNANFPIDIHNPDGGGQAETEGCPHKSQDYDIPYRSIVPKQIDGLLLAGRCISGTHRAHASYRVMNICMACGDAAGTAAALCIRNSVFPRDLDPSLIQDELQLKGAVLFN